MSSQRPHGLNPSPLPHNPAYSAESAAKSAPKAGICYPNRNNDRTNPIEPETCGFFEQSCEYFTQKSDRLLDSINAELLDLTGSRDKIEGQLHELIAKLDLYSRIDEFTAVGHFEFPDYLFETSPRFAEEIKLIREKQRDLIKQEEES